MDNLIAHFIDQNDKVTSFIEQFGRGYEQADVNIEKLKAFLIETNYSPALAIELTNTLQCLNKAENFANFDLKDLSRLFTSLIKVQEGNIETYLEAGHFEWSVMDNKQLSLIHISEPTRH